MSDRRCQSRAVRPGLEPLEGRAVLSVAQPGMAIVPAALVQGVQYLFLEGAANGTVQLHRGLAHHLGYLAIRGADDVVRAHA